jgi:hypothetical protein
MATDITSAQRIMRLTRLRDVLAIAEAGIGSRGMEPAGE